MLSSVRDNAFLAILPLDVCSYVAAYRLHIGKCNY